MPVCRLSGTICVALGVLSLSACATAPLGGDPLVRISGMAMENQTEMFLSSVSLLVPATGGFVSCGTIAPGSICSTTFPEADYSGNPVEITWSQGGQVHSSGRFALQIPTGLDTRRTAVVRVVITGLESAGAIIVQRPE